MGNEECDISIYGQMLEFSQAHADKIRLYGGFLPCQYSEVASKKGLRIGLKQAKVRDYVSENETCDFSRNHFNVFESVATARALFESQ